MVLVTSDLKKPTKKTKANVRVFYLVTGFVKTNGNQIKVPEKSLEIMPDRYIFVDDPESDGKLLPLRSDKNGLLSTFNPSTMLTKVFKFRSVPKGDYFKIYMPPGDAVMLSWFSVDSDWVNDIQKTLKESNQNIPMKLIPLKKKYFREPLVTLASESEQKYTQWYNNFGKDSEEPLGIVFPKARGIVFITNDSSLLDSTLSITPPEGSKYKTKDITLLKSNGNVYGLLGGSKEELPKGLYDIEITPKKTTSWNTIVRKSQKYKITEPVRFDINKLGLELSIVICDPVTVEDALIKQFPAMLSPLIKLIKDESELTTTKPDGKEKKVDASSQKDHQAILKSDALKTIAEKLKWTTTKTKFSISMINSSRNDIIEEIAMAVADKLIAESSDAEPAVRTLKNVYGVFGTVKSWKDFNELRKNIKVAEKDLKTVMDFIKANGDNYIQKTRWWKYLTKTHGSAEQQSYLTRIAELKDIKDEAKIKEFLRSIPEETIEKSTRLKVFLKKAGTGLKLADTAISTFELGIKIRDVIGSKDKLVSNNKDISRLFDEYAQQLQGGVCYEAMDVLERFRSACVGSQMEYEKEQAEALASFFDTAVGAVAITPTPAALLAQAILLVKSSIELTVDLVMELDKLANNNLIKEWYEEKKLIEDITLNSLANQQVMPGYKDLVKSLQGTGSGLVKKEIEIVPKDFGKAPSKKTMLVNGTYFHVQYAIRAEVLYGLMGLLARAAFYSDKNNTKSYDEKLKHYGVKDFIDKILLTDGWFFPMKLQGKFNFDTWWHYHNSKYKSPEYIVKEPLENYPSNFIGKNVDKFMNRFTDEIDRAGIYPQARFNDHFPVHKLGSDDFSDFAKMLTPIDLIENTSGWIDQAFVYSRPKDSDDDIEWSLLNEYGVKKVNELPIISPFDQVRVLIVMNEDTCGSDMPDGVYPISMRLLRVDGINVSGPVYKGIVRTLSDNMLLDNGYEKKYLGKKRKGIVLYPFYEFGDQIVNGIKPISLSQETVTALNLFSKTRQRKVSSAVLDDMRYAFEVKLGKTNQDWQYLTIGAPAPESDYIDSFRMKVDLDDPEQKKLDYWPFLESHNEKFDLPELLVKPEVAGYYVKVGNKPLKTIDQYGSVLILDPGDWNENIEIIVLIAADGIKRKEYEGAGLNWYRVPMKATLFNVSTHSDKSSQEKQGPDYEGSLHYVGKFERDEVSSGVFTTNAKFDASDRSKSLLKSDFTEFLEVFNVKSYKEKLYKNLIRTNTFFSSTSRYMYAAKIQLKYVAPGGQKVNSIRPIANKLFNGPGEYFEFAFRHIRSGGKSGLYQEKVNYIDLDGSDGLFSEFRIKIEAPKTYTKPFFPLTYKLSEKVLEDWIVKQSDKYYGLDDSQVHIVKK